MAGSRRTARKRASLVAALSITVTVLAGLCAPAQAASVRDSAALVAPVRDDSADEPVYLVKGYTRLACGSRWRDARAAMRSWGWTGKLIRVGFYETDTKSKGCDVNLDPDDGSEDTRLKDLGRALAWNIHNRYSSRGKSVDLVGHSMGGLIVRAALTGYARKDPTWPKKLLVEDVVTLGTPHLGTPLSYGCSDYQCRDMRPTSGFIRWLAQTPNPQADQGTDWTLIGSQRDFTAPQWTSVPDSVQARHLVRYRAGEELDHSELRYVTEGRFEMDYRNQGGEWRRLVNGAAPIRAAHNALYWAEKW